MYDKICPDCGTRLSQFYQTSMLGCPTCYKAFEREITLALKKIQGCYKAFEREITLALKKIQGGTSHAGKTPYGTELDKKLLAEYEMLIKEKERAGIEQRFSDVNELSAQILDLSEELKRRGLI